MPSYGQSVVLQYVAWDTGNNGGKTGDVANHTLRWVKDGTSAAPTNTPTEVDATNAPGVYKLTLTSSECQCQAGTLCGKSSTAGVSILPVSATFENLPTALPAAAGGLPVIGTGAGAINPSGGKLPATVASGDVTGNVTADVQSIKGQSVVCAGTVTFPAASTLASTVNITAAAGCKLDLTQAVPTSNTAQTLGDALNAARAQGFGKWVLSGTTLTLYAPDGTTSVRAFTLDSATAPLTRS